MGTSLIRIVRERCSRMREKTGFQALSDVSFPRMPGYAIETTSICLVSGLTYSSVSGARPQ